MINCYKRLITIICFVLLILTSSAAGAQQQRISSFNNIGWYAAFATVKIADKLSSISEVQWRRTGFITYGQQSLAKAGFQYHFDKKAAVGMLYAYILTYPYGDYPPGPYTFPEHRITEQLTWSGNTGRFVLFNRIRLEQRWTGNIDQKGPSGDVENWIFTNRVRYQLRVDVPINNPTIAEKTWYAGAYDEVFVGFGKNVNRNVFDQNRLALELGYRFTKHIRLEGGYFCQILQQGAPIDNKSVFQYNQGVILNMYFNNYF